MKCPSCDSSLRIGKTFMTFEGDNTPNNPIKAFQNMPMICINPICTKYGGTDLSNPIHVVETTVHAMN